METFKFFCRFNSKLVKFFTYPLQKDRKGQYKIQSGELIRVCMSSDFFLEEADEWRDDAWSIMRKRPDVKFFLLTKRPQRVKDYLPKDWGDGWDNVFFNVPAKTNAEPMSVFRYCSTCRLSIKALCVRHSSARSV